ncbi:hypothetical protein COOONC_01691 [Cooperia oncophora]
MDEASYWRTWDSYPEMEGRSECKTFNFSPVERFRFFWFLVSKAAVSMFLCLVVMAHSPQLHDYNAEDDTTPLNF